MTRRLHDALVDRSYPGRGCLAWRSPRSLVLAYFMTGRSDASRARRLEPQASGDIEVVDTSGGPHDALRHYVAATTRGRWTLIGNGDHVVPLTAELAGGLDPVNAWRDHSYEPDPPIFTPRIWAGWDGEAVVLGSVRRSPRDDGGADRVLWLPELDEPGSGVLVTTYEGSPLSVRVSTTAAEVTSDSATPEDLLDELWSALDPALRVAAVAVDLSEPSHPGALRHAPSAS